MISFSPPTGPDAEYFGERERLDLLRAAAHILIVDDQPQNIALLTALLERAGFSSIAALTDAQSLESEVAARPPDLVLLDLHMPGRNGFQALDALRKMIDDDCLPVLMMTADDSAEVRRQALARGARDFITKPFDILEVSLRVRNLLETRLLFHDLRKQNRALHESMMGRTRELESTRVEMVARLAIAAEYRDDSTNRHNERVGELSGRIAATIGMLPEDCSLIQNAAALHDVGKIGIPDALLRKPGPLTPLEVRVMRTHTTIGARILGNSHVPLLRLAETIAYSHHERWDGQGYPTGRAGTDIPLPGRIAGMADAFDAMTSDRPYRPGMTPVEAIARLRGECNRQFEGRLVDALESIVLPPATKKADTPPRLSAFAAEGRFGGTPP